MSVPEMSGPGHYREAERLLAEADDLQVDYEDANAAPLLQRAQVHATLALAAATAYPAIRDHWAANDSGTPRDWAEVAS